MGQKWIGILALMQCLVWLFLLDGRPDAIYLSLFDPLLVRTDSISHVKVLRRLISHATDKVQSLIGCAGIYMKVKRPVSLLMKRDGSYQVLIDMLLVTLALTYQVKANEGFITLDCGLSPGSSYMDKETGIKYSSDALFIDSGVASNISDPQAKRWFQTLRSFPGGPRNCYNIKVKNGTQYLIRANFNHGHNHELNHVEFELCIGNKIWDRVRVNGMKTVSKEIILITTMNYLFVCLKNINAGMPFISSLELRPMMANSYNLRSGSLRKVRRLNFCSLNGEVIRFPSDAFDREWEPFSSAHWRNFSTTKGIQTSRDLNVFHPPSDVLRTAASPKFGDLLKFEIPHDNGTQLLHVYLYLSELKKLKRNQSRTFVTYSNQVSRSDPLSPMYLRTSIVYYTAKMKGTRCNISLAKTADSTLPPIINAVEFYSPVNLSQSQSDPAEVDAMMNIKLMYGVKKNWQGDPCVPQEYVWDGVSCGYNSSDGVPKITELMLSWSKLVGTIAPDLSNLALLETLDLSNNDLTGPVPEFLAQLPSLKFLNIAYNNLNGSIPPALIEKSKRNLLQFSYEGNPDLCASNSCKKKKKKKGLVAFLVLASISAAAIIALVATILLVFRIIPRRIIREKQARGNSKPTKSLESQKWKEGCFTYSQLMAITNNFQVVLGQGGSGIVYHGYLHGNQVAVKILSSSSTQGYRQFQAEVDILLRVHHGNLLSLVGFCDECNKVGLIYEYMVNGNLQEYISGDGKSNTLSWEQRLKISLGAAQGLEYLHNGCNPQIVHRDVKTANILLNENLLAKLADFGLSRSFPVAGASHVFTDVVGTFGYFDPEYFRSRRFTTKSDVYSFGVVLLEIITSKPAVNETEGMTHLSQWVSSMLAEGEVASVVDPKLGAEFDINSVRKAIQLAMTCVSEDSSRRPTMHELVIELTDCLAMELSQRNGKPEAESEGSSEP